MNLASVLSKRRRELGLTLAQIADQVGVTEATVQRWECGIIKNIRHEKISRLAEVLKVSPATLMGWDEKEPTLKEGELQPEIIELAKQLMSLSVDDLELIKVQAELMAKRRQNEKAQ